MLVESNRREEKEEVIFQITGSIDLFCLGSGAGGFSGILHLHAHALRDCVVLVQYQLSDVSISC
ncbi:hypothetical protein MTR_7g028270 [Medicago truncatula]|uniref:Uncharacterized protein n=1 Tax=Medicago truncatula TaxID=3880 RepID=G7L292_MEDTR|nr:hypothetical protein MTR_7g028270 [Medicago truncatula]